jgi:hypothetical protein
VRHRGKTRLFPCSHGAVAVMFEIGKKPKQINVIAMQSKDRF